MLEVLIKLYVMAMAQDVRSPTPHLFGPPGCGKSSTVEQLAALLDVNLHIINVARLSPLEVEGLQMPVDDNTRVHLIPAAFWSRLKDGDIVLFDEFLRGFPEVYNGLLDIFTSRRAGDFRLPKVFMIAASNSVVTYDKALEDRLIHLPVKDPRKSRVAKRGMAKILVEALGLLPEMVDTFEMNTVLDTEVLPMFDVLDDLYKKSSSPSQLKGHSIRNLIGQAQLRHVKSSPLKELILANNRAATASAKWQYVYLLDGTDATLNGLGKYAQVAPTLVGNPRLTPVQATNLKLNLQLIELETVRHKNQEGTPSNDVDIDDLFG